MSRKISDAIYFKNGITFEEWLKNFDSKEVHLRHYEFEIKPLPRGFFKNNHKKIICINQSPEGNIQKFVQANNELIRSNKVDFSTMEEFSWV